MSICADLILANRSYLDHLSPPGREGGTAHGEGGLLAALRPVIAGWDGENGTTWIGAARGRHDREWTDEQGFEVVPTPRGGLRHRRLYFDPETWDAHYGTVSNSFLWPLLHLVRLPLPRLTGYYPTPAAPDDGAWAAYERVNQAFAEAAAAERAAPTCWVHDYQLGLAPRLLREAGFEGRIGFFLHTPFPDLGVAAEFLDSRARRAFAAFVRGMLGADLVGLQTAGDAARFRRAACELVGARDDHGALRFEGRGVQAGAYPVGIDAGEVAAAARGATIPPEIREQTGGGLPLVLGLERCDFTKGIPERLAAVADAFRQGLRFTYVGIAAPTRPGVEAYRGLEATVDSAAADAASAAREGGGVFLQLREAIAWQAVVALQREADVVFTSSLADGMNLVPLQAAVAQSEIPAEERGVTIAGKDAGVATVYAGFEEDGLAVVDPFDSVAMVGRLAEAIKGRPGRISDRLVAAVRGADAQAWATRFLTDLGGTTC